MRRSSLHPHLQAVAGNTLIFALQSGPKKHTFRCENPKHRTQVYPPPPHLLRDSGRRDVGGEGCASPRKFYVQYTVQASLCRFGNASRTPLNSVFGTVTQCTHGSMHSSRLYPSNAQPQIGATLLQSFIFLSWHAPQAAGLRYCATHAQEGGSLILYANRAGSAAAGPCSPDRDVHQRIRDLTFSINGSLLR